jgi:hypothetical protein
MFVPWSDHPSPRWNGKKVKWTGEPHPRREEALLHGAHLVLDLPLLPTGDRVARHGIDQITAADLQEPAVLGPVLAHEDRVHRSLRPTIVLEPMANKVSLS